MNYLFEKGGTEYFASVNTIFFVPTEIQKKLYFVSGWAQFLLQAKLGQAWAEIFIFTLGQAKIAAMWVKNTAHATSEAPKSQYAQLLTHDFALFIRLAL